MFDTILRVEREYYLNFFICYKFFMCLDKTPMPNICSAVVFLYAACISASQKTLTFVKVDLSNIYSMVLSFIYTNS